MFHIWVPRHTVNWSVNAWISHVLIVVVVFLSSEFCCGWLLLTYDARIWLSLYQLRISYGEINPRVFRSPYTTIQHRSSSRTLLFAFGNVTSVCVNVSRIRHPRIMKWIQQQQQPKQRMREIHTKQKFTRKQNKFNSTLIRFHTRTNVCIYVPMASIFSIYCRCKITWFVVHMCSPKQQL